MTRVCNYSNNPLSVAKTRASEQKVVVAERLFLAAIRSFDRAFEFVDQVARGLAYNFFIYALNQVLV